MPERTRRKYLLFVSAHASSRPLSEARVHFVGQSDLVERDSVKGLVMGLERELQQMGWGELRLALGDDPSTTELPPEHLVAAYDSLDQLTPYPPARPDVQGVDYKADCVLRNLDGSLPTVYINASRDLAINHYHGRLGMEMPWTIPWVDEKRYADENRHSSFFPAFTHYQRHHDVREYAETSLASPGNTATGPAHTPAAANPRAHRLLDLQGRAVTAERTSCRAGQKASMGCQYLLRPGKQAGSQSTGETVTLQGPAFACRQDMRNRSPSRPRESGCESGELRRNRRLTTDSHSRPFTGTREMHAFA